MNIYQFVEIESHPLLQSEFARRTLTGRIQLMTMAKSQQSIGSLRLWCARLVSKNGCWTNWEIRNPRNFGLLNTLRNSNSLLWGEGRSDDFQKHFCGTHFFNPARYLKLFEIIPGPQTSTEVLDFLTDYGSKFLGKTSVLLKILRIYWNRIGIYGIQSLFHLVKEMDLQLRGR